MLLPHLLEVSKENRHSFHKSGTMSNWLIPHEELGLDALSFIVIYFIFCLQQSFFSAHIAFACLIESLIYMRINVLRY